MISQSEARVASHGQRHYEVVSGLIRVLCSDCHHREAHGWNESRSCAAGGPGLLGTNSRMPAAQKSGQFCRGNQVLQVLSWSRRADISPIMDR